MRVFVTGGNGFVGSHIVRELLSQNHEVTCLVRRTSSLKNLESLPVIFVYGDITSGKGLNMHMKGHDAVVHTAGRVDDWSRWSDCYITNVQGTMNVVNSCHKNGIERVVITGSTSSYGEENSVIIKDETSPDNSHHIYFLDTIFPSRMNNYHDSKAIATRKAVAFAKQHTMNMIVLEPGFVYGEREFSSGFYEYVKSARSGFPVAPGSKRNCFPIVYAGDLAKAYAAAVTSDVPGVHRIIITNSPADNMNEIYSLFCRFAGCRQPLLFPKVLLYIPAFLMEIAATFLKSEEPPLLTRARCNMFYDNVIFSAQKAYDLLGFRAETSLAAGIEKTVRWYRENGYL